MIDHHVISTSTCSSLLLSGLASWHFDLNILLSALASWAGSAWTDLQTVFLICGTPWSRKSLTVELRGIGYVSFGSAISIGIAFCAPKPLENKSTRSACRLRYTVRSFYIFHTCSETSLDITWSTSAINDSFAYYITAREQQMGNR